MTDATEATPPTAPPPDLQWMLVNGLLTQQTLVYDDDELWYYDDAVWKPVYTYEVHSYVRRWLYNVVRRLPDHLVIPAKLATANVRLRKPIADALIGAVRGQPKIEWYTTDQAVAKINHKITVFDFQTGEKRPPRDTDYIKEATYIPSYIPYQREEITTLPECALFLLDAFAYALRGRSTDRIYYGLNADYIISKLYYQFHPYTMSASYYVRAYMHQCIHSIASTRITVVDEPRLDDIRYEIFHAITDGSGSITYNGETYKNRTTFFFRAKNTDITITDPLILSRLVYVTLPPIEWPSVPTIVSYLYDRAMELNAPPPIPISIQEDSARIRKEWVKISVEEWITSVVQPAEIGIAKQAAWEIYQTASGNSVRLEHVSRSVFYHVLDGKIGPAKKVRGIMTYVGWTLKI